MKASDIIIKLQNIIKEMGDLQVGFYDTEYSSYEIVKNIEVKKRSFGDTEDLGDIFIGID